MKYAKLLGISAILLAAASCNQPKGWSVSGTIEGAEGTKAAIEAFNNGIWYVVDSVATSADGSFSYTSATAADYPEVYRLSIDGRSIYFPIDSIDNITIHAAAENFPAGATVTGTPAAEQMQTVDALILAADNDPVSLYDLKRQLVDVINADSSCMVAYYIINRTIDGRPLFTPDNAFDARVYGAVAQRFNQLRPNDPRGAWMLQTYLAAKSRLHPEALPEREIEADLTGLIDIELYDNRGTLHRLSEVAGKGKPVVLSFTAYALETSPAYNVLLNDLYEQYKERGLQIYQVSFDRDEIFWKQNAANLPWITVFSPATDGLKLAAQYNVTELPLTYVIDANGDIAERVTDPSQLGKAAGKLF